MKINNKKFLMSILIIVILLLVACQQTSADVIDKPDEESSEPAQEPATGLANPAAVYCEGLGYSMESTETEAGQDADCIFPDGQRCGQWDFLSGRCGREYSFCAEQGGTMQDQGGNVGVCLFEDGSTCDEFSFFSGECQPGDNPPADE